jgi:twitching motility protein PilT
VESVDFFLQKCLAIDGSDLHFKTDTGRAYIRVHGDLHEVEAPEFSHDEFKRALFHILSTHQVEKFQRELELDFAYEMPGVSRFRGNVYQQRGNVQAAFRVIPYEIQSMEDLHLPPACYDFIHRPRGLVLVTGPAGSGKTTTLAAMIDKINRTQPVHIMTVEDPVEFVHEDHLALINQRELDVDTMSFANALKYVLRQDPDVILVGEMRDLDTIHLAITAAETGHLVFGTLHTVDSIQTVDRMVDVFPTHQQQQIRMQLSVNLVGVVSQTLVKRKDGRGRVAAHEVMVASSAVRNLIRENKSYQIGSLIQTGSRQKMNTLDQALASLVDRSLVSKEDARHRAKDPQEFDRLLALDPAHKPVTNVKPNPAPFPSAVAPKAATADPEIVPPPISGVRGQPNRPQFRRD